MKKHLKKRRLNIHTEHIKIFVLIGLIFLALIVVMANKVYERLNLLKPTTLGVSFSPEYTQALGLNPKKTYQEILTDLKVKHIRLNTYWSEIEPQKDRFDFSGPDYYIAEAQKQKATILLTIGLKQPRWPECRIPTWVDQKNTTLLRERQLHMLREVISRYENSPTVTAWQLENEPLFSFGVCPSPNPKFLQDEVVFVRSLTNKPIYLTDSGELGTWIKTLQLSPHFGTTLYRTVEVNGLGQIIWPLKPWFYRLKPEFIVKVFNFFDRKIIISELQAEPWSTKPITDVPLTEQVKDFPTQQLEENVIFAKKVGFPEIYLWGVEWWAWMKIHGHPEYWESARQIFL